MNEDAHEKRRALIGDLYRSITTAANDDETAFRQRLDDAEARLRAKREWA